MAKNIFVGSIPFSVGEDAIYQLFSEHGQVQTVKIIKDKYTQQSRGFAFVEMAEEEDAKKAIAALNGHELEGRRIIVKEALPKPSYDNNRGGGGNRGFGSDGFSDRGRGGGRRDFGGGRGGGRQQNRY